MWVTKHSLYFVCSMMVRSDLSYCYSFATHGYLFLHACLFEIMLTRLPLRLYVKKSVNVINVEDGSRPCIKRIVNWALRWDSGNCLSGSP